MLNKFERYIIDDVRTFFMDHNNSTTIPDSETELARLLASRNMILNTARSCVGTMEILWKQQKDFSSWHIPFYLLAATALELYAKLVIAEEEKKNGTSVQQIEKRFRDLSHNLDTIYSSEGVGNAFLSACGISTVFKTEERDLLAYHYDFHTGDDYPVYVYHLESLRYGLLAGARSNAGLPGWQIEKLLALCQKVAESAQSTLVTRPLVMPQSST